MDIHFELLSFIDSNLLRELRNENKHCFLDTREISIEEQHRWVKDIKRLRELNLFILDSSNNEKVGFISLYDICRDCAKIGRMMMLRDYRHQGYMKRAMIKVFRLAKDFFGIKELLLEVRQENIIARDLYVKMGFVTYGLTKEFLIMRKFL